MNELLFISIIISLVINVFLFTYLYQKKAKDKTKDGFVHSSLKKEPLLFVQALEAEINRVERYEEYSFCLASLELDASPSSLLDELQAYVRKSDSVYIFDNTIHIIFPFLKLNDAFRKKMDENLVAYIKSNYNEAKLLNVELQECNINNMINTDLITEHTH